MRSPALVRFHAAHDRINFVARCTAGGLNCLLEYADDPSSLGAKFSQLSPHWGQNLPFSPSDFEDVVDGAQKAIAELLVVKAIANFEGYLVEIDGMMDSIGKAHADAGNHVPVNEDESLIKRLARTMGPDYTHLLGQRSAELGCLRFFLMYRHRLVHSYGYASERLVEFAQSQEFEEAWTGLAVMSERSQPAKPLVEGGRVELGQEHAVLASILANRLAAKCDEYCLVRAGRDGLVTMVVRSIKHSLRGREAVTRAGLISGFLNDECQAGGLTRDAMVAELKQIGIWHEVLEA